MRTVGAVTVLLTIAATTAIPADAAPADAPQWSRAEHGFVVLLNQVRADPGHYAERWDIPELAGLAARPPLAPSDVLAASAAARSAEMAQHGYFAHQSPITGLWPNAVARQYGFPLPDFLEDTANNIESLASGSPDAEVVLSALLRSPTHRRHLIGDGWFATHLEIGVGYASTGYRWTIHTAARNGAGFSATGTVYDDGDGDRSVDPGEGLSGVTVSASTGAATTTDAGGGWALPLPVGTHTIIISGGPFVGTNRTKVTIADGNVLLDAISGTRIGFRTDFRTCAGHKPTIVGTNRPDRLIGTPGDDVIWGGSGNDIINGRGGDDIICGGPGDDTIMGGTGNNHLRGGGGEDTIED